MLCRVTIRLEPGERMAAMLYETLGPDNVDVPEDLQIRMSTRGGALVLEVAGEGNLPRVIGTIDEMLAHAQVALDVTRS